MESYVSKMEIKYLFIAPPQSDESELPIPIPLYGNGEGVACPAT